MKKIIAILLCAVTMLTGCSSNTAKHAEKVPEGPKITLSIHEEKAKNLRVDIEKKVDVKALKKYTLVPSPFPVSKKWVSGLIKKYYGSELAARVYEIKTDKNESAVRSFGVKGTDNYLAQEDLIHFVKDLDFYNNCEVFFRNDKAYYPFFHEDMDRYFSKNDLTYMSYTSALHMAESLLDDVELEYNENAIEGYSLATADMLRYQKDHQESFNNLKKMFETVGGSYHYIEDWSKNKGFFAFYIPIKSGNLTLAPETMTMSTFAEIVIDENGVAVASLPAKYRITGSKKTKIVMPEEALNKLVEMYKNTIYSGTIDITNVDLIYTVTDMDSQGKSDIDIKYHIMPCWRFNVTMTDSDDHKVESTVSYDATTNERTESN